MASISAAFFDVDGVLRHVVAADPRVTSIAFNPEILEPAVTGVITDARWRELISERVVEQFGSEGLDLAVAFHTAANHVDADVLEIVREVRQRVPVGLLTNQTDLFESLMDGLGFVGEFDAVVNSARVGVAKPSPEIFVKAAAKLSVDLKECVFVDDTPANVEAAAALGVRAVHYRGAASLRSALRDMDLCI